jgi:hypothetical protein
VLDPQAVDRIDLSAVVADELGEVAVLPDLVPSLDALTIGTAPRSARRIS